MYYAKIFCSIQVSIYAFGRISGGHFNPAVTVALAFAGKLPEEDTGGVVMHVLAYCFVQCFAAI